MKRKHPFGFKFLLAVIVLCTFSCREEFDSEFRVVPIINNAPELSTEIGDREIPVDNEVEIDLAGFITDAENDPISYSVTSSDESVATVSVGGSLITITTLTVGSTTISISGNDGNEGNDISTQFTVTVVLAVEAPEGVFVLDFDAPNGTLWEELEIDGVTFEFEQDDGAVLEVSAGVMEWSMDEFSAIIMAFDEPLDISENPILQFDYAGLWNEDIFLSIADEDGNTLEDDLPNLDGSELILNNPSFNTYTLDLSESGLNLSAITEVFFEKYEGPGAWRFDNFILGPSE